MTTTGRPTIGPKTTLRIPQADLDRLTTLAQEHDTDRSGLIREAISTYLGPNMGDPRITEWVADAHANAWTWWTTSTTRAHQPTWNQQAAHAIWQANMVIALHSSDWNPDLTPVWEIIAAAEYDEDDIHEEGADWGDVLTVFGRIAQTNDLDNWVEVQVDMVNWTLMVHTGGPFGAMRPATYKWGVGNSIRPYIEMDGEPDVFAAAVKLLLPDLAGYGNWEQSEVPAYMVPEAKTLLAREDGILPEWVDQAVSVWEKRRRSRAEDRVGGPLSRGLDFWAKKLLGREHPVATSEWEAELDGKTDAEVGEERRAEQNSKKEIRSAYEALVQTELAKMDQEELAARHRAEMDRYEAEAKAKALRDAADVPLGMEKVLAPNPGRRHLQLLVSPPEMTQEQWERVLDSDHDVYVAEVTNPHGGVVDRWIGNQDWEYAAEDYLTGGPGPRRGSVNFGPRTHTVTVWATPDRYTPSDTLRWSPAMQADMDESRAREAQKQAERLARAARASRREVDNPTPDAPAPVEEPLTAWERELLEGKRSE